MLNGLEIAICLRVEACHIDLDISIPDGFQQPPTAGTPRDSKVTPTPTPRPKPTSLNTSITSPAALFVRCRVSNKGISQAYPNVFYIDKKWIEISCGVCGANATYDTNLKLLKFFGGTIGLNNHIISHRVKDSAKPGFDVVLTCFKMRELSNEDVGLIQADRAPKTKITMCLRG
jgi:hypothetical protein